MNQIRNKLQLFLRGGAVLCSLGACLSVVTAQTCVEPPAGVVSWWPGNQSARDIIDGNHGKPQHCVEFRRGMVRRAFDFDGVDDFVQVPRSPECRKFKRCAVKRNEGM
jgi:hypothetical protein